MRKICAYFHFGQRAGRLKEIQTQSGTREPLKVLRFVEARWTSLMDCSERLTKLCKYFEIYFKEAGSMLKEEMMDHEYELYT